MSVWHTFSTHIPVDVECGHGRRKGWMERKWHWMKRTSDYVKQLALTQLGSTRFWFIIPAKAAAGVWNVGFVMVIIMFCHHTVLQQMAKHSHTRRGMSIDFGCKQSLDCWVFAPTFPHEFTQNGGKTPLLIHYPPLDRNPMCSRPNDIHWKCKLFCVWEQLMSQEWNQ